MGNSRAASREKGERIFNLVVDCLVYVPVIAKDIISDDLIRVRALQYV